MYNNKGLTYSASQFYVPGYGIQQVLEHLKQFYGNPPIYIHENGKYFATIANHKISQLFWRLCVSCLASYLFDVQ